MALLTHLWLVISFKILWLYRWFTCTHKTLRRTVIFGHGGKILIWQKFSILCSYYSLYFFFLSLSCPQLPGYSRAVFRRRASSFVSPIRRRSLLKQGILPPHETVTSRETTSGRCRTVARGVHFRNHQRLHQEEESLRKDVVQVTGNH